MVAIAQRWCCVCPGAITAYCRRADDGGAIRNGHRAARLTATTQGWCGGVGAAAGWDWIAIAIREADIRWRTWRS